MYFDNTNATPVFPQRKKKRESIALEDIRCQCHYPCMEQALETTKIGQVNLTDKKVTMPSQNTHVSVLHPCPDRE